MPNLSHRVGGLVLILRNFTRRGIWPLGRSQPPTLGEMELSASAQSRQPTEPSIGPPFRCQGFLPRDGLLRKRYASSFSP